MSDIFISYSREDSPFVEALMLALIEYGWSVWADKSGMAEGRPFDEQIEDAIVESTVTLVIWSPSSVKSRWVRAEAAFALGRDKLLPVIIRSADPPLQFLHIHGADLTDWSQESDDAVFRKLAAILSERLDRVGRIPDSQTVATAPVKTGASSVEKLITSWKPVQDLLFPPVGKGFGEYFAQRTFYITQVACVFGFCLVTLFGILDFFAKSGDVEQTRFRFVVTGPSLLIMLGLSFTPLIKQHSQKFVTLFASIFLLLAFRQSSLVEYEYPVTTGAATTVFLVVVAVMVVLPLRVLSATMLCLLIFVANEGYIEWANKPISPGLHAGYDICVLAAGLAMVVAVYFRERLFRKNFIENEQATARIAELKDRLMALATQRNQA
jgi:TIR domain